MLGYWRRPEEEALVYRGEWFCGGDLAHLDDDGYVWFHGRNDDILNPMGYRLSPLEIEGVLARHPMVQEVAVGELAVSAEVKILAAFVVPQGEADEAVLIEWARQHLATYKQPRKVVFVDHLPRIANRQAAAPGAAGPTAGHRHPPDLKQRGACRDGGDRSPISSRRRVGRVFSCRF